MKKLILIRHGDAPRSLSRDLERELSPLGKKQAALSAAYLKNHKIDRILCSTTKRTRQTLKVLQEHLPLPDEIVEFCDEIYSNDVDILAFFVGNIESDGNMLIVGHNPSLLEFVLRCNPEADEKWHNKLMLGLKPAEVIVLGFPKALTWRDGIERGAGRIEDIFIPA